MDKKYQWLVNKTPRSVEQLRLWAENPRLNPEESHLSLIDFAEDLTEDTSDRKKFYELVKSIAESGFIPADPIVVWQNEENKKYYVAEGNRRVIALKLLLRPEKAPKSIRAFIRRGAEKLDSSKIKKIPVNVAPSFEEAEWYINQRNSTSSLQERWTRVQQQRWIATLYNKHNGDINKILSIVKMDKSEIESFIRILKIKDFVKNKSVKRNLTEEEFEKANSYRFPITILERIFNLSDARTAWGIEYNGVDVVINSNKKSFYNLFSELIKKIINKEINTRFTKEDWPEIFSTLPQVLFTSNNDSDEDISEDDVNNGNGHNQGEVDEPLDVESTSNENDEPETNHGEVQSSQSLKNNPDRSRVIIKIYSINTDSCRLQGIFEELKKIPVAKYPNNVAASLRIFLDLAILKYIETEGLESDIKTQYKESLKNIQLRKRLGFLVQNKIKKEKPKKIINILLNSSNQYSLDVLNGYMHSKDTHYLNKQFLNGFWDFLFPLFEELLDIKEEN